MAKPWRGPNRPYYRRGYFGHQKVSLSDLHNLPKGPAPGGTSSEESKPKPPEGSGSAPPEGSQWK